MAFGVVQIPGSGGAESPQKIVDGFAFLPSSLGVTITPVTPGDEWDAVSITNNSSDWIRATFDNPIGGNQSALVQPGGGVLALSFGDGGINPITQINVQAVDVAGVGTAITAVDTLPPAGVVAADGIVNVVLLEK